MTPTNELQPIAPAPLAPPAPQPAQIVPSDDERHFALEQRMAKLFWQSQCFSDVKGENPETAIARAFVKIAIGKSLGLTPGESMMALDFIQGTPAIRAHTRAAKMQQAGFRWAFKRFDSKGCVLHVYDASGNFLGESSYVEEDAKANGLLGKDNWRKNPKNMYFCRAISNAQRWYAAGVLMGGLPSVEEMYDAPPRVRESAEVNLADFVNSTEANRGHDAANPNLEAGEKANIGAEPISDEQVAKIEEARAKAKMTPKALAEMLQAYGFASARAVTVATFASVLKSIEGGEQQ